MCGLYSRPPFVFLFALRGAINNFFMQLVELAEVNLLVSSRRPPGDPYTLQRGRIIKVNAGSRSTGWFGSAPSQERPSPLMGPGGFSDLERRTRTRGSS